jgi:diguanylate cyclase (GGDEF)-like protein/PAS domain S-box-containing protein
VTRFTRLSLSRSDERYRFLVFAAIYIVIWGFTWYSANLLDIFGFDIFGSASLWFLPAGLRFCCLLLLGWPGLLLEMAANLIYTLLNLAVSGNPVPPLFSTRMFWALFDWYALPMAYAAVILPVRRWIGREWDLTQPVQSLQFLFAALAASAASAWIGTYHLVQTGGITPPQRAELFASWLIGDFIGIVTLAPLLLVRVWPRLRHYLRQGRWQSREARQAAAHGTLKGSDLQTTVLVALTLLLVFGFPVYLDMRQQFPLIALSTLLTLAAVALRNGLRASVLAVFLLDSGMVLIMAAFHQREFVLQYQLVMIAIALVGLWLGGTVEASKQLTGRYRDFASVSNDLLWETDSAGRLLNANGRMAQSAGLVPGTQWRTLLAEGAQPHRAALEDALLQQQPFTHLEIAMQSGGSKPRWIQINGLPLRDESGNLIGYRGTATDFTQAHQARALLDDYNKALIAEVARQTLELRESNSELRIKEQHLQVLLAAAPVGVLELDNADCCRYLNVDGGRLTGCLPSQAQGLPLLDFVHRDDRDLVDHSWNSRRQSDGVQWLEFRLNRSNLWCSVYWISLQLPDQSMDGTIMVLVDSTARRQQDERLWMLAHHDPLTNLPNRKLFWDRSAQALSLAKRRGSGVAILCIDLDAFKAVNDTLGHDAGDALLREVALRLKSRVRDSDTVVRMGGDEFAVIMPDVSDSDSAVLIARELVASLGHRFDLPQGTAQISGSIGVALYPQHALSAETLTRCADMAMYSAKRSGKNQVCVWDSGG